MKRQLLWIDKEDALAIHDMLLAEHGGLAGIREFALLESALHRPRHLYAYDKPTLPELAGAYAGGLIQNHPFYDGNKRTGFLVAATFLEINGMTVTASEADVVLATVSLAARKMSEAAYALWLTKNSERTRP